MKILHSLEGKSWSGGQQQALFLAQEQHKMGHNVLLACQKNSVLEQKARELGLAICPNDYRREINPFSMLNLLRAYDSFGPDVVNVHRAWAHTQWIFIALLRRFKGLVVTRRVLFKPDSNPVSIIKYKVPVVRGYIAVSEAVSERLRQIGVKDNRIRVVYSASDTDRFSPDLRHDLQGPWPLDKCAETGNSLPVALMVGNYSRNKGHQVLIEAFKKIADQWPDLRLVIAGKDTDSDELKRMIANSEVAPKVSLLGFRSDVPALMQRSLFSVNASFQEGFSGTIRESMSMGVPVIASAIPANNEIARMIPMRLFSPGDSSSLAQEIIRFKTQGFAESDRQLLRKQSVDNFSVTSMVQKTLDAYKSILRL